MSRVLMIGAGGVATVAAFKIAQNTDVFSEFMIASRRKEKCDKLVESIHKAGLNMFLYLFVLKERVFLIYIKKCVRTQC